MQFENRSLDVNHYLFGKHKLDACSSLHDNFFNIFNLTRIRSHATKQKASLALDLSAINHYLIY